MLFKDLFLINKKYREKKTFFVGRQDSSGTDEKQRYVSCSISSVGRAPVL